MTAVARGARSTLRWRDVLAATLVLGMAVVNAVLVPRPIQALVDNVPAVDWLQFVEGARRVSEGDLYETTNTYGFRYSPLWAYVAGALESLGTLGWRLLHVAAALALPTWPMRLVTLAAWPFWYDVETGNVLVFALLAAAWAVRGSRFGIGALFVITLLLPRPLMLPVVAWVLWKHPRSRLPALGLAAVHLAAVLATGWADDWLALLLTLGAEEGSPNNLGPTRILGAWWLLFGIPLAALLTWRGRLGWASLAMSYPYVLPYYLLMLVLELPDRFRLSRAVRRGRFERSPAS